ncbi:bifunctional phosphoribosylaminoimidazole carboxylase/phosphoribosylaminoimidazole succinocarboxamide synthetase isoform X6 [Ambystoma mexicanum]|uniref:bifunctional phosphoribosylaminoimidazole carboxylase/phosphoribosylaminoimidazole succinocarboxamide synthetase isoform X6 n=1 Tax=Ambystoma mexicanum TaxID=8296 RepID=UPI0037E6FBB7
MERGTGRYWTEEEIKALLSVWSEKHIRKQLRETLRNKGIFVYIAKRLQELGVCRDWKQCRAKYKNLKYEYRTVKGAHSSGEGAKTMRFFHELDGILRDETGTESAEEEVGLCTPSEAHLDLGTSTGRAAGEISTGIEDDDDDTMEDALPFVSSVESTDLGHLRPFIESSNCLGLLPPIASEGGKHWTVEEVRALVHVWSDKNIQRQLEGTVRNKGIFEQIAVLLQEFGVDRDWKQCRTKYKNLKHEFKMAKKGQLSGNPSKIMRFFEELETILGPKTPGHSDAEDGEDSAAFENNRLHHVREIPEDVDQGDSFSNIYDDPRAPEIKKERIDKGQWILAGSNEDNSINYLSDDPLITYIKEEENDDLELCNDMDEEESVYSVSETAAISSVKKESSEIDADSISTTSDDPAIQLRRGTSITTSEFSKPNRGTQDHQVSNPPAFAESGRHWTVDEVRTLIQAWSDKNIQRQLEGTVRNKIIFEHIASLLQKHGIDRDWKQCRTKYKNLKYEYKMTKKAHMSGDTNRTMRFFSELDAILGPKTSRQSPQSDKGENSVTCTNSRKQHCASVCLLTDDDGASTTSEDTPTAKRIPKNEHSTSRNCGEETGMSLVDEIYKSTGKRKGPEREIPVPIKKRTAENIANSSEQNREDVIHRILKKTFCKQQRDSYGYNRMRSDILHPHVQACRFPEKMEASAELKLGKKLNEGKTKQVYELPDLPGYVLMQSKDQITAGNMAKKDQIEGKAFISNKTTSCIFKLLQEAGIKSAFVRKYSDTAFIAAHCEMIPIEWVCRRIATGSFLKRNPGVKEGYKFYPPKIETFFKDDANNDPEWSEAQLIEAKFVCAGLEIGQAEVDIMNRSTLAVFEILEKAWSTQECTLVDMKIEFGVDVSKQEIVLADVIDNDSWRLWPSGDRSQQKDKQVYRDLKEVTPEALQMVKRNFEWVADKVELLLASKSLGRVVVLMGSISDLLHCEKIKKSCANYGIPCELRVTSAHKGPDETLRIKAEYEGDGIPTVFVAVAGRSNGLGPVMSGNTAYPVINCPPLTPDWGSQDVWSSLRMPSGLGCSTVLSPEAAAQFAAQIFGLTNHLIWSKLRSSTLNTWISLKQADKKLRECSM